MRLRHPFRTVAALALLWCALFTGAGPAEAAGLHDVDLPAAEDRAHLLRRHLPADEPLHRVDDRALHGLTRTLVANMVEGVTKGFEKTLEIQGVGYRAALRGTDLELNVGFSHPVVKKAPQGITFEVPAPNQVVVKGIDKQKVGQIAAEVRSVRPPEPYKGKGIRYAGEYVRRKVGKRA